MTTVPAPSHARENTGIASLLPLSRLINIDTSLSLQIHTIFQPIIPRSILKSLEISGDGRFWFPIPIALLLYPNFSHDHHRHFLVALLLGFLLDILVVGLVKHLVRRPRPVYNKGMNAVVSVDHWSFPSGHSSRVFFIASFFWLCSKRLRDVAVGGCRRWRGEGYGDGGQMFEFGVFVWAVLTSTSRILLGRHFVVDVVAGVAIGLSEGYFPFIRLLWHSGKQKKPVVDVPKKDNQEGILPGCERLSSIFSG